MNAQALLARLEQGISRLDPSLKAVLASNKGAAFEALVMYEVGQNLHLNHSWDWNNPGGRVVFSARSGCSVDDALATYSTISKGNFVLLPSATIVGRSESTHDVDLVLLDTTGRQVDSWTAVRAVIECKNVTDARGPGTARDLVGLAAELRLGKQYRLHASKPFNRGGLVAAHKVTSSAVQILHEWKLHHVPGFLPTTGEVLAAPALADWVQAATH